MKNKKGFTLIELLAVIVILAIIALIAVPVIMNIITQARKSAFKDTAYGIIKAGEFYYSNKLLDINGMTEDVTIILPDADNILNLKGEMPNGLVQIDKTGKIALAITNGKYCIMKEYDDTNVTISEDIENCAVASYPFLELATISSTLGVTEIDKCAKEGTCEVGTAFAIKVNDTETYKFYVVSDDGNQVQLIMSENAGTSPWVSSNDYGGSCSWKASSYSSNISYSACVYKGPITLLNNLDSATSEWINIPARDYTYSSSNYSNVTVNMRASVPSKAVFSILTTISQYFLDAFWSADNLSAPLSIGGTPPNLGFYWTGSGVNILTVDTESGIRPVITLDKKKRLVLVNNVEISEVDLYTNSTYQIESTTTPENASNQELTYASSNTSIATVSETGLITAVAKGTATITVTATNVDGDSIRQIITVTVRQLSESITLDKETVTIGIGTDFNDKVTATVLPSNTSNKTLTWTSNDTSIATVSNGTITGVSLGSTTVTVTTQDGTNISKTVTVNVVETYENGIMQSFDNCINEGTCSNGTAIKVAVNDTESYWFYTIADTGSELTLIMNQTIGSNVAWISKTDYATANTDGTSCGYTSCNDEGPVTAINVLKETTSGWTNVVEKEYTYSGIAQNGTTRVYDDITETMRARMITYDEVWALKTDYAIPSWLYGTSSYWVSTANTSYSCAVYYMDTSGPIILDTTHAYQANHKLRPVITITK